MLIIACGMSVVEYCIHVALYNNMVRYGGIDVTPVLTAMCLCVFDNDNWQVFYLFNIMSANMFCRSLAVIVLLYERVFFKC